MANLLHPDEEPFEDERINHLAENGMLYKIKKNALKECDESVKRYIACTNEHYVAFWKCYEFRDAMNECLKPHTSMSVLNRHKKEYLADLEAKEAQTEQE